MVDKSYSVVIPCCWSYEGAQAIVKEIHEKTGYSLEVVENLGNLRYAQLEVCPSCGQEIKKVC